jgi:hypothetical protein
MRRIKASDTLSAEHARVDSSQPAVGYSRRDYKRQSTTTGRDRLASSRLTRAAHAPYDRVT